MKKSLKYLLCMLVLFFMTGCSNKVEKLMKDENYLEALNVIKESNGKYDEYKDECRYLLAKQNIEDNDYDNAYSLLQDNNFKGAKELQEDIEDEYNKQVSANNFIDRYENLVSEAQSRAGGTNFTIGLKIKMNLLRDSIDKENDYTQEFEAYFNSKPSIKQEDLKKVDAIISIVEEENSDLLAIDVINYLTRDTEAKVEDRTINTAILIEDTKAFLQEKGITDMTLAYMCCVLSDYGIEAEIGNDGTTLELVCEERNNVVRSFLNGLTL